VTSNFLLGQHPAEKNDPQKHPTLINRNDVDSIGGKPIDFYLNHRDIDAAAKLFYLGKYALYDDNETFHFLNEVLTDHDATRPFYFFIFNQALKMSDGALAEIMSSICRTYVAKYPCEFLRYLDDTVASVNVAQWASFIGFDVFDKESFEQFSSEIEKEVKESCPDNRSSWSKLKLGIKENLEEK
jgi:hypothetical protein